jgi:ParB family chromosome partitioning protein
MTTPNKKDKEALGKGIRSLLQNIDSDLKTAAGNLRPAIAENLTGILRIPLDLIETNPRQPRKDFDEVSLQELAASIRIRYIQPVTVAKLPTGNTDSYRETPISCSPLQE